MSFEIIDSRDGTSWSEEFTFTVGEGDQNSMVLVGKGMVAETVPLEFTLDEGTTWQPVEINGTSVALSVSNTHIPMNIVGTYRLNKTGSEDITASLLK